MQTTVGIACTACWILYLGQLVSVVDFGLAQRLGLQEKPENVDPLFGRLELQAARWDLLWLWILPAAGVLMLLDHAWWPYVALVGGGATVDTGGREAVKVIGLRAGGVRTGTPGEDRLKGTVFKYFVVVGLLAIGAAIQELS